MGRWPLVALAAMAAAIAAASTAVAATSDDAKPTAPAPIASPHAALAVATPAAPATSSGATVVRFRYAPQVLVQLDVAGRPWRLKTNTGKAPASADQLDVADASGTPMPATAALRSAVAGATWTGDWSAVGAWHAWPNR